MALKHIAAIVAPFGASGMLLASLTPYNVMARIGEMMEATELEDNEYRRSLTMIMLMGFAGACLLSVGMIIAVRRRLQPTPPARNLLLVAAVGFGLAILLIASGNAQMRSSLIRLSSTARVEADSFLREVNIGKLPMLIGYSCVVIGASSVFGAGLVTSANPTSIQSTSDRIATIVTYCCSLILCLATLWTTLLVYRFEVIVSNSPMEPAVLGRNVSRIISSVYLSHCGLGGFSLTCLLLSIAKVPPNDAA